MISRASRPRAGNDVFRVAPGSPARPRPEALLTLCWLVPWLLFALPASAEPSPSSAGSATEVPAGLAAQIRALQVGPDKVAPGVDGWSSRPSRGIESHFDSGGLRLRGESEGEPWELRLRLAAYGRDGTLSSVGAGSLHQNANRAELDHGGLRQWVRRSGAELQQGFVLPQRPYRALADGSLEAGRGELILDLELGGSFDSRILYGGRSVELRHGRQTFEYRLLEALDRRGRSYPVRMELSDRGLRLRVDDEGAAYPLAVGTQVTQIKKLFNPLAQAGETAGWAVALQGDTAVVGAFAADVPLFVDAGKVYIYERDLGGPDNWGLKKEIRASDAWPFAHFGSSVAIDGDHIVVGSDLYDDFLQPNSGRVYLFERNAGGPGNWGQIEIFTNPSPQADDSFGWDVAIEGHTLVISAYRDDLPFLADAGLVYIYDKNQGGVDNWGLVKMLQATQPQPFDHFGHSLALHNGTLAVGAMLDDVDMVDEGSVYIFERDQGGADAWGLVTLIQAIDGKNSDRFGDDVDL
ncbi:MAG: FG-GAP repeat protein, partial [Holophagales bacterium]|nr:FG-GAP repeat protein [Holophagales bacterium]